MYSCKILHIGVVILYAAQLCIYSCMCVCIQYYSSEHNKEKGSSIESDEGESSPVHLLKELLEDALQPNIQEESSSLPNITHSGYSTSYCWPPLNNSTLGLHRHQPAQSCEHILNINVTAPSGFYWIDPNLGCSSDAVHVYCNFTSNETCIHPNSTQVTYIMPVFNNS